MKIFRTLIASVFSCSVLALGTFAQEAQNYKDSDFDFSLSVPAEWKSVGGEGYTVPGKLRAAFKGPGPSSIVVFVQEPGQAYDARFLLDASAEGLQKALKSDIKEKEVREIDGKKAMWLLNEGQGNGGAGQKKRRFFHSQGFPRLLGRACLPPEKARAWRGEASEGVRRTQPLRLGGVAHRARGALARRAGAG